MPLPDITITIGLSTPLLARGVASVLSDVDEFAVLATSMDSASTLREIDVHQPRIALVDVRFHRQDASLVDAVREIAPATRLIFIIDHEPSQCFLLEAGARPGHLANGSLLLEKDCCLAAVRDGAGGCCWSEASPEELIDTVARVAAGHLAADPWLEAEALQRLHSVLARDRVPRALTPRQEEIVSLVSDGLSNREIASRLDLAEQTVKNHVTRAMRALGARNRVQLACAHVRSTRR